MVATAKHRVNYNGTYHEAGERFEIAEADARELAVCCELEAPDEEILVLDEPVKKRGRPKKDAT